MLVQQLINLICWVYSGAPWRTNTTKRRVTNRSHVVYLDEQSKMQPGVSQQGAINSESIARERSFRRASWFAAEAAAMAASWWHLAHTARAFFAPGGAQHNWESLGCFLHDVYLCRARGNCSACCLPRELRDTQHLISIRVPTSNAPALP